MGWGVALRVRTQGGAITMVAWRLCVCVCIFIFLPMIVDAQTSSSIKAKEPYMVEGLVLGTPVAPNSWQYKRFNCRPSTQYENSTWCKFTETDGGVKKSLTLMHLYNNIVTYINKELSPAFFTNSEVDHEIARLSHQFNSSPRILKSPDQPGLSRGIIASWGGIELQPLSQNDLAIVAQGKSPNQGILVDYLLDFTESARAGLPVYSVRGGGAGYLWIARLDKKGKEKLRFFAADPSEMKRFEEGALAEKRKTEAEKTTAAAADPPMTELTPLAPGPAVTLSPKTQAAAGVPAHPAGQAAAGVPAHPSDQCLRRPYTSSSSALTIIRTALGMCGKQPEQLGWLQTKRRARAIEILQLHC
jgi:hypothetical protein